MALVHGFLSFLFCHLSPLASPEAFYDEQTMQTHSSTEWLFEESWHFCRYSTENQFPIDPAVFHAALPKRMLWSCWTAVPIGSGRGLRHLFGLSAEVKDADISVLFCFFNQVEAHILKLHLSICFTDFVAFFSWLLLYYNYANKGQFKICCKQIPWNIRYLEALFFLTCFVIMTTLFSHTHTYTQIYIYADEKETIT